LRGRGGGRERERGLRVVFETELFEPFAFVLKTTQQKPIQEHECIQTVGEF
jgi:hypothetical protein